MGILLAQMRRPPHEEADAEDATPAGPLARRSRLVGRVDGFDLDAGLRIAHGGDVGRETLASCCLRPPFTRDRLARYAFNVEVARILTALEHRPLRAIVEYLKPTHTHFVDPVEPLPPTVPNYWELGFSDLAETTDLH